MMKRYPLTGPGDRGDQVVGIVELPDSTVGVIEAGDPGLWQIVPAWRSARPEVNEGRPNALVGFDLVPIGTDRQEEGT